MNVQEVVVTSQGYRLFRLKQAEREGLTLQMVADETALGISTVSKFCSKADSNVAGAALFAAWVLAEYFGVPIEKMIVGVPVTFPRPKPAVSKKKETKSDET